MHHSEQTCGFCSAIIDRSWKRESGISPNSNKHVHEDTCNVCGIGDESAVGLEDVSEEAMRVRKLVDLKKPSQQEVDEHFLSHLPFRNWCPHCMKGKAK